MEDVIICPGSRSALLTLAFVRHGSFKVHIITDERSAAYIALGMAQRTRKTVVIICTSGTAALNFAPAVAEAFHQEVPLLVLTADRPVEWIGQYDGQTIFQHNIYAHNIKASYSLPSDKIHQDTIWYINRMVNEALIKTNSNNPGPVHINVPIREPFYPAKNESLNFNKDERYIVSFNTEVSLTKEVWDEVISLIINAKSILLVGGFMHPDEEFKKALVSFQEQNALPLIAEPNSNLQDVAHAVVYSDLIFKSGVTDTLKPDLLITFGREILSKSTKKTLRNWKVKKHIHIGINERIPDSFQSVSHLLPVTPVSFFKNLLNKTKLPVNTQYRDNWRLFNLKVNDAISKYFSQNIFNEIFAVKEVLSNIPHGSVLHTGNSLPVRYVNMLSSINTLNFCNRGTSGIDGCVSTAIGSAIKAGPEEMVFLLLGDVAFFYDRNAFWNNVVPVNLRIVVINNHGGAIFRTVEGAKDQPELEQFFVTNQPLTCESIAKEFNLEYYLANDFKTLTDQLKKFVKKGNTAKILEVEITNSNTSQTIEEFSAFIKSNING